MYLFTYGSLMYPQVWSQVMNRSHDHERALVRGYARRQLPGEVYPAMITAEPDSVVEGVLYAGMTEAEIARLDGFENEGVDYQRVTVPVETSGAVVNAYTYIYMHPARVAPDAWDPGAFEATGLQHFLDTYVRRRA